MSYKAIYPYNGKEIKTFKNFSYQKVDNILDKAEKFYQMAKKQPFKNRAILLNKLAEEFLQNIDKYAKPMTTNMGKLFDESQGEIKKTANFAQYYAKNWEKLTKKVSYNDLPEGKAYVEFSSTGIVLAIEPWNFPYTQVMRVLAPNFLLGNPVILKHASIIPECAEAFENACKRAGLPEGAFTNLFVDYSQIDKIIADDRVQGVALTGSENAGRKIAASAGKYLKKSTMELGGTDIFAVLGDADAKKAAKDAAAGRLQNSGQICTSSKRFLVNKKVYSDFKRELIKQFSSYQLGDPFDKSTTLAPLSSKGAQQTLQRQVDRCLKGGAKLIWGDKKPIKGPGCLFNPLIISGIQKNNPMYDQELFGPVAQLYKVNSDEELVNLANDSHQGLGGAIYTGNIQHGQKIASQIETGMLTINQIMTSHPEVPWGGIKNSGYGRELNNWGIYEFANIKPVIY